MPLSFVPVLIGLALHVAGGPPPHSFRPPGFAEAAVDTGPARPAAPAARVDPGRGGALHRAGMQPVVAVACRDGRPRARCAQEACDLFAPLVAVDQPARGRHFAAQHSPIGTPGSAATLWATPSGDSPVLAQSVPPHSRR